MSTNTCPTFTGHHVLTPHVLTPHVLTPHGSKYCFLFFGSLRNSVDCFNAIS